MRLVRDIQIVEKVEATFAFVLADIKFWLEGRDQKRN